MKSLRRKAVAKARGIKYHKWNGTCVFEYGVGGGVYFSIRLPDDEFLDWLRYVEVLLYGGKK